MTRRPKPYTRDHARRASAIPLGAALLTLLVMTAATAAQTAVRLVAADRDDAPLVSTLADFRLHPDGGLIVTQWISGVRLDGRELFEVTAIPGRALPQQGEGGLVDEQPADEFLAQLDEELKKDDEQARGGPRPLDTVDRLYVEKNVDGRLVGPVHTRISETTVRLVKPATLEPAGTTVQPDAEAVDLACYPVTIVARPAGATYGSEPFAVKLAAAGRDLTRDWLFEHSPDMPLGDTTIDAALDLTTRAARGSAGGKRVFRRLTVYLPANAQGAAYELNGHAFRVTDQGVTVERPGAVTAGDQPWQLVITTPATNDADADADEPRTVELPVLVDVPFDFELVTGEVATFASGHTQAGVTVRLPDRTTHSRLARIAAGDDVSHGCMMLLGRELATRTITASRDAGGLLLNITQVDGSGPVALPDTFDATLTAHLGGEPIAVRFTRQAGDTWRADVRDVQPGLYELRTTLAPTTALTLPVAITPEAVRGSVTLYTYHNREDYLRGEAIELSLIIRAAEAIEPTTGRVRIEHETGEVIDLGEATIACAAGATATVFMPVDTSGLRLGKHTLRFDAPGVVTYAHRLTLYDPKPTTTMALFNWHTSFSGSVRVGEETVVNHVMGRPVTQLVSDGEAAALTAQRTVDARFVEALRRDPLMPAPERTLKYDPDTEAAMAAAMRMGVRYAPWYSWGMNPQESDWNPKHTLPDDLDRYHRMSLQVAQRHAAFGNFAGLHLNWYPTLGGYWENHPRTDGHAHKRNQLLGQQTAKIWQAAKLDISLADVQKLSPEDQAFRDDAAEAARELSQRAAKYRIGAFARAYREWTAGVNRHIGSTVSGDLVFTSFVPVGWFFQQGYYPPVYFSTLPVAGVHGYTDYGYSPFQPMWGIDHYAAGVGDQPVWVTSITGERDTIIRHMMFSAARGADGIDLGLWGGTEPTATREMARLMTRYGSYFRVLEPHSDVAILDSFKQQTTDQRIDGKWMGYNGGSYYDLYGKLWYAGRPARMMTDDQVTLDELRKHKALFLINQRVPLSEQSMAALEQYVAEGGRIFKNEGTADYYPGERYTLEATPAGEGRPAWEVGKYVGTRDGFFVGALAGYEAIADSLNALLGRLDPPRVKTSSHEVMVAQMDGRESFVAFVVNTTRPRPGIYHPWNFWCNTIMAAEATVSFDKPYVVYDVLAGGERLALEPTDDGRFATLMSFDRAAGRMLVALPRPIASVRLHTVTATEGGDVPVRAEVLYDDGSVVGDPLPCEITLIDEHGRTVQQFYRGLHGEVTEHVTIPRLAAAGQWRVRVREMVTGRSVEATIDKRASQTAPAAASPVKLAQAEAIAAFLKRQTSPKADEANVPESGAVGGDPLVALGAESLTRGRAHRLVILLDESQASLVPAAERLAQAIRDSGRSDVDVRLVDPLDIVDWPQRWYLTRQQQRQREAAMDGRLILKARPLLTRLLPEDQSDFVHPTSGYEELGALYRIYDDVILLGMPATNRFIDDLKGSMGVRPTAHHPAAGGAVVELMHDAFVAHRDALVVMAHDSAGLRAGIDAVLRTLAAAPDRAAPDPADPRPMRTVTGDAPRALPDILQSAFGRHVYVSHFYDDGRMLVSTGTDAANYHVVDADGRITRSWFGRYSAHPSGGERYMWVPGWWGVTGYNNMLMLADRDINVQWMMATPAYHGNYKGWTHPGRSYLIDTHSNDIFLGGGDAISRVNAQGKVVWRYDDVDTNHTIDAFRHRRDLMLHDISDDGRWLLVAAYGITEYAGYVTGFVRPQIMLVDTANGSVRWAKDNFTIDHSVLRFTGGRIVAQDSAQSRLVIMGLDGSEQWSTYRPQGTSRAALTPDGAWMIVQPEAPRDRLRQVVGEPQGLAAIRIADKTTRDFPLTAQVHRWTVRRSDGRVLISTTDGRLRCFEPDATLVWERQMPGPSSVHIAPDGETIIIGTSLSKLLWLDGEGRTVREADFSRFHIVRDQDAYVAAYTRPPGDAPVMTPTPAPPAPIDRRCAGAVAFSANLVDRGDALEALYDKPLTGAARFTIQGQAGRTHVGTIMQRAGAAQSGAAIEVRIEQDDAVVYRATLPASDAVEERTFAWRPDRAGEAVLTLSCGHEAGVVVERFGLFVITPPGANVLVQKDMRDVTDSALTLDLDAGPGEDEFDIGIDVIERKPPDFEYLMPNDVDLRARARGDPPFMPKLWPSVPVNGQLDDEQTSWHGASLRGKSTHARFTLTFKDPVEINAIAVHEDTGAPGRFTRTYAVFARDAKTQQWRKAGHVVGNRSAYNLFTFEPIFADQIVYLWLDSADGHARIAEIEAFTTDDL